MKSVKLLSILALTSMAAYASAASPPTAESLKELAPQGTLRVAVAMGRSPSAFWATRDPVTGEPRGVTVALANSLAQKLGVPLQLVPFQTSAALTNAAAAGAWDVAFVPADIERAKVLDFTSPYYLFETSILVRPSSQVREIAQIDRRGVRVAVIAGTTTMHNTVRILKKATVVPFQNEAELKQALSAAKVDAAALSGRSLRELASSLPGSRILDGTFHAAGVAAAVPKDHPAALAYLRDFIEEEKASGTVQKALESSGISPQMIAPPVARQ